MNIPGIVKELVLLISPALPYLVPAGEEMLKKVGGNLGTAISQNAIKVWTLLNSEIVLKPPALEEALKDVSKNPEDEDAQASLRLQLKKLLESNPELTQKLSEMMASSEVKKEIISITQVARDHGVQIGYVSGSVTNK